MRKGIPTTWANKEGSSQMHYPHVGFLKAQEDDIRQIKEHTDSFYKRQQLFTQTMSGSLIQTWQIKIQSKCMV